MTRTPATKTATASIGANDGLPPLPYRTFITGMSGSGKSVLARAMVRRAPHRRVIVCDPTMDWRTETSWPAFNGVGQLARYFADPNPPQHVIVTVYDYPAEAVTLASWCMKAQAGFMHGRHRLRLLLVLDEASGAMPSRGSLDPALKGLIERGRHYGIDVVAITQRPSQVHADMRSNSGLRCYLPVGDEIDWKPVRDHIGREGEARVKALPPFTALACDSTGQRPVKAPLS